MSENEIGFLNENGISLEKAKDVLEKYERDHNGNFILKNGDYIISDLPTDMYKCSEGWIFLPQIDPFTRNQLQGSMALIKTTIPEKCPGYYTGTDGEMLRTNIFILSEVAKQFQLKTANYYNTIFRDSKELESEENSIRVKGKKDRRIKSGQRYILTPSFRGENEELLHYADMLSDSKELRAKVMLDEIKEYLRIRHIPEEDIEQVEREFIKQTIFNKFIEYSDEHNSNGGVLITNEPQNRRARLAPSYDLDFATGIYNVTTGSRTPMFFFRTANNGRDDMIGMLEQFKGEFVGRYLQETIGNFDLETAIEQGERNGNFRISDKARRKYTRFFSAQIRELTEHYEKEYGSKRIDR